MKVLLRIKKAPRYYILKSQLSLFGGDTHPERVTVRGKTKTYTAIRHKSNETSKPADKRTSKPVVETKKQTSNIKNFGEHIGGSRAELAALRKVVNSNETPKPEKSGDPAWKKKYSAHEQGDGRWQLKREKKFGSGTVTRPVSDALFDSKEEAIKFIPVAELLTRHSLSQTREGDWYIYRRLSTGRALTLKGGFTSKDETLRYMHSHPEELMKQKAPSPERPFLDKIEREGKGHRKGDVTPQMFHETFGFRGGEFGNWNKGGDGQAALNHAYDGLMDLAGVLNLPPGDISLGGELSIAFGARGKGGKKSARAHYEPIRAVINLTKVHGAGTLAHEWFHAFDQYVGRMDGKAPTERQDGKFDVDLDDRGYISHGVSSKSNLSPQVQSAVNDYISSLSEKTLVGDYDSAKDIKRLQHQTDSIKSTLDKISGNMTYWVGKNKKAFPATDAVAFRDAAQRVENGTVGEPIWIQSDNSKTGHMTFAPIEEMNKIYKKYVGRGFSLKDEKSLGQELYRGVKRKQETKIAMEAERKKGQTEKRVKTDYFKSAKDIDDTRSSPYWTTVHEMAARAFEGFVEDKIHETGKSQYLVHSANNDVSNYKMMNMKPYPEGDERKEINGKIEKLLSVIREAK